MGAKHRAAGWVLSGPRCGHIPRTRKAELSPTLRASGCCQFLRPWLLSWEAGLAPVLVPTPGGKVLSAHPAPPAPMHQPMEEYRAGKLQK